MFVIQIWGTIVGKPSKFQCRYLGLDDISRSGSIVNYGEFHGSLISGSRADESLTI
jgi:hypothetical protein